MPDMTATHRTFQITKLVKRKMLLLPVKEGVRQYTLGFSNSSLMRGSVRALFDAGFISPVLNRSS